MRKIIALTCVLLLSSIPALAQDKKVTDAKPVAKVAEALQAKDDTPAILEGVIVETAKGDEELYYFQDSTGIILIEISDKVLAGKKLKANDKVKISGKVDDKDDKENEVDVEMIEMII